MHAAKLLSAIAYDALSATIDKSAYDRSRRGSVKETVTMLCIRCQAVKENADERHVSENCVSAVSSTAAVDYVKQLISGRTIG